MNKDFQQRIRRIRDAEQRLAPDASWVQQTRQSLMSKIEKDITQEGGEISFADLLRALINFVPLNAVQWIRTPLVSIATLVAILTGGSALSVSAAERSMPGDFFYGLKLATEQARLALTSGSGEKLNLKAEFTDRRVAELKQSSDANNSDQVVQVAQLLKQDLNTLQQQLGDVAQQGSAANTVTAAKLVNKKTAEVVVALQATKEQLTPARKEQVTEVQSVAASTGAQAIEVLVKQQDNTTLPVTEVAQAIADHATLVASVTSSTLPILAIAQAATSSLPTIATSLPLTSSVGDSASSSAILAGLVVTSSTASSTVSQVVLPAIVDKVKDATEQAFQQQKLDDLSEATTTSDVIPPPISASSTTSTLQIPLEQTSGTAATPPVPSGGNTTTTTSTKNPAE